MVRHPRKGLGLALASVHAACFPRMAFATLPYRRRVLISLADFKEKEGSVSFECAKCKSPIQLKWVEGRAAAYDYAGGPHTCWDIPDNADLLVLPE